MQSDAQQIPSASKSPYLSQYKHDISAKQRLIRQRLGTADDARHSPDDVQDKDAIPSIDGEEENTEQVSTRESRSYKSRFSYVDDEAEASLQFFKKNLLPNYVTTRPSNISAISRSPDKQLPPSDPSNRINTTATKVVDNKAPLNRVEPKTLDSSSRYQLGSGRPVPFKQTSINDNQVNMKLERTSFIESPAPTREPLTSRYNSKQGSSSIRAINDKLANEPSASHRSNSSERHRGQRSINSERATGGPLVDTDIDQPVHRVASRSGQDLDGRQSTESASQSGTFLRKPLYNSLLRAHDSIRLKVNRPKVRPKSEVPVEDTEVVDDIIPLANINSHSSLNERAVDVKRGSSKRKSKKKEGKGEKANDSAEKATVRNFSEVRVIKILRSEGERSLGVTVRAEEGNIVVARIMAGSLADKQGALQVGDVILSVNNREVYTPEQLQEQLRKTINDDSIIMKIVPSFREELPTLCIYLRALFNYDPNEDTLLPCKEIGVTFNQGDILEVVNQEDPNWWQARRVDSENLQTGLIPSQELEERRRAFVIPDYDLATKTSICGTKVSRKSRKKEIYNVGQNSDFDKAELQLYEEVCRTPAFERRTLVLIGASGVGKQALKARLITMDPDRFGAPLPHTSRLPRDGEEDGIHYHFVTRERMEEDIIDGKYLEYGEYDGALYGTKLDSVREIIGAGKVCVLDCSATCLKILKTSDYLPFVAFIAAPTLDQLRYEQESSRGGSRNYTTFDRALSRQSRRAKTLQDFAFDFFEDEDLQVTVEESARLFRVYENYFDIVLVNNHFESTFEQLRDSIDALSMAPQWIPISWIYGT